MEGRQERGSRGGGPATFNANTNRVWVLPSMQTQFGNKFWVTNGIRENLLIVQRVKLPGDDKARHNVAIVPVIHVGRKHERDASRRRYDGTVLRRSCCKNIAESAFNEMNSTTFLAQTVSPAWTTPTPSLELFEERRARQQRENPATTGLPGVDTPGRRTRMAPRRPS
jgi:hypothetical protein